MPSAIRRAPQLHSQGLRAVPVRSNLQTFNMKYIVVFLVVCVALAAAAPQLLTTWPGIYGNTGYYGGIPGTLVAGPSVTNTVGLGYGGRIITPGYVGPALF